MNTLKHLYNYLKTGFLLVFLLFFIQSCVKETIDFNKVSKKVEWDPKLAIPLVDDNITLKDLVNLADSQGYVKEYVYGVDNGLLYIIYEKDVSSKYAEDSITIPDQSFRDSLMGIIDIPPIPIATTIKDSSYIDFDLNRADELDSIYFKSGTIILNLASTFPNSGNFTIVIDSLRRNNAPFTFTGNLPAGSSTTVDLTNYKLYLKHKNGKPNQIKIKYTITLQPHATPVQAGHKFLLTGQISSPRFSVIFGYISPFDLFNFRDKDLKLDIFELDQAAKIYFRDPRIKVCISSTLGVPLSFKLDSLSTHADGTDVTTSLAILSGNNFEPKYPISYKNLKPALDTAKLDSSNIPDLGKAVATVPQDFIFDAIGKINPHNIRNSFLMDTSRIDAKVVFELPFNLRIETYEFIDTLDDLDLSTDIKDFSILDSIKIYNTIENRIPFEVRCQVYFTDSIYNKIDSLYSTADQPVIPSGELDALGKIIPSSVTPKIIVTSLTGPRIKNLEKVRKGLIRVNFSTTGAGLKFVKFYNTDNLRIKLGMQVNMKVRSLDQFK